MNWIKTTLFPTSSAKMSTAHPDFERTCLQSCDGCDDIQHAKIPDFLLKKISDEDMSGSVKTYDRHLLIKVSSKVDIKYWPGHVDEWKALQDVMGRFDGLKWTICTDVVDKDEIDEEARLEDLEHVDLVLFPDRNVLKDIKLSDLGHGIETILNQDMVLEKTTEKHVLVCAHTRRDKRCGVAGPLILQEMKKHVMPEDGIRLLASSHIGGHKFAGTMIIYPYGIWYGRVLPCHAGQIINDTVKQGKVIEELFRGTMTIRKEDVSW